jgi:hypothetical protein
VYLPINPDGISQKNLASNPSVGIGLNPNLNIEDEYIENLLKQVHFLNMEIKLMYFAPHSARRSKRRTRAWASWACSIRIRIPSSRMQSPPITNTLI